MAYLGRARKEDLELLADELNLNVTDNMKIADLCKLITTHPDYDEEFTENYLTVIIEDRILDLEKQEFEKEKERRDRELEKLRLEIERLRALPNTPEDKVNNRELTKVVTKFKIDDGKSSSVPITCTVSKKLVNNMLISAPTHEIPLKNIRLFDLEIQRNSENPEDKDIQLESEREQSTLTMVQETEISRNDLAKSTFVELKRTNESLNPVRDQTRNRQNAYEIDGILMHTESLCGGKVKQVVLPTCKREEVDKQINESLQLGLIEPSGKDGRHCVNYGLLKSVTITDAYRMQNTRDPFDSYIDDVAMYSTTSKVHLEQISKMFKSLEEIGMKGNLRKCAFGRKSVKFLGHIGPNHLGQYPPDPGKVVLLTVSNRLDGHCSYKGTMLKSNGQCSWQCRCTF